MKTLPPVGRPNGGRLGKPKETTGCLTCKKRRIKCDEQKPFCLRCTSTRRNCEGYAQNSIMVVPAESTELRSGPSPQSESLLSPTGATNEQELRAFRYFVHGGAAVLSGDIDLELWCRLIPQQSHHEPSIRHSIIAIGSLLMQASAVASLSDDELNFALWHYNKAIQLTLESFQKDGGGSLLYGITCMLFFCIEALQGREAQALSLFQRGNKAHLAAIQSDRTGEHSAALAATFTRMTLQCGMFNGEPRVTSKGTVTSRDVSSPFTSIAQARNELSDLILQAMATANEGFAYKIKTLLTGDGGPEPADSNLARAVSTLPGVLAAFEDWHSRFASFRSDRPLWSEQEVNAASVLLIHHEIIRIWLLGAAEISEMVYDEFQHDFEQLMATCSTVIEALERSPARRTFTFEMGLITPLYIAVLKCRSPWLRRQFLALLRRAPAQEGLWNRSIMAQVGQRVIDLEESAMVMAGGADAAVEYPSDETRLWLVKIETRTVLEDGRCGDFVEFYAPPNASNGFSGVVREFFSV